MKKYILYFLFSLFSFASDTVSCSGSWVLDVEESIYNTCYSSTLKDGTCYTCSSNTDYESGTNDSFKYVYHYDTGSVADVCYGGAEDGYRAYYDKVKYNCVIECPDGLLPDSNNVCTAPPFDCPIPNSAPNAGGDLASYCKCIPDTVPIYDLLGSLKSCLPASCPSQDTHGFPLVATNVNFTTCANIAGARDYSFSDSNCCFVDTSTKPPLSPEPNPDECPTNYYRTNDGDCSPIPTNDDPVCPPEYFYSSSLGDCVPDTPDNNTDPDSPLNPDNIIPPNQQNLGGETGKTPDPNGQKECGMSQYYSYITGDCEDFFPEYNRTKGGGGGLFLPFAGTTTKAGLGGTPVDSDGDGFPDGIDTDGDGIPDNGDTNTDSNTTDDNVTMSYDTKTADGILGSVHNQLSDTFSNYVTKYAGDMISVAPVEIPVVAGCGCTDPSFEGFLLGQFYHQEFEVCSPLETLLGYMRPILWFVFIVGMMFSYLRSE